MVTPVVIAPPVVAVAASSAPVAVIAIVVMSAVSVVAMPRSILAAPVFVSLPLAAVVARVIIPRAPVPVVGTILVVGRTAFIVLSLRSSGLDLRFKVGLDVLCGTQPDSALGSGYTFAARVSMLTKLSTISTSVATSEDRGDMHLHALANGRKSVFVQSRGMSAADGALAWSSAVAALAATNNFRVSGRALRAIDVGLIAAACSFLIAFDARSRETTAKRARARAAMQRLGAVR